MNLETIEPFGAFDTHDGLSHRIQVLTRLNELVKTFVKKVAVEKNIPAHLHDTLGGKIYTFGSYRLGVHTKNGDIDTLCVVPTHVTRTDFFTTFHEMLKVRLRVEFPTQNSEFFKGRVQNSKPIETIKFCSIFFLEHRWRTRLSSNSKCICPVDQTLL